MKPHPFATSVSFILLLSCGAADDPGLREVLRAESSTQGIALAEVVGDSIRVIPFDSRERNFKSEYGQPEIVVFGSAGKMVLWQAASILHESTGFAIRTVSGEVIATHLPNILGFRPGALNEASRRIAYWGIRGGQIGLHWIAFDSSDEGSVDSPDASRPSWSIDGSRLVYQKNDSIYLYDLQTRSSKFLVKGNNPTVAPNGKLIAFRAPGGRVSLMTDAGVLLKWVLDVHQTSGSVRWSPDGRYVSFPVRVAHPFPVVGIYDELLVCRVSDGKTVVARKFGAFGNGDANGFHWMFDYRKFCVTCVAK